MKPVTTPPSIYTIGTIAIVIGNRTAHCFELGQYVICVPREEEIDIFKKTYGFTEEHISGQYLSSACIRPVGFIPGVSKNLTTPEYQRILRIWKQFPNTGNRFYTHAARTQKARGLQVLSRLLADTLPVSLVQTTADLDAVLDVITFPIMVRPCPIKPRHGFVESRIAKSKRLVKKIFNETKAADPYGEVLLMPPIQAEFSSVVTDHSITIGRGTDGATSGKQCVSLPCLGNLLSELGLSSKYPLSITNKAGNLVCINSQRYAGIRKDVGIFVETVGPHKVQLRTGPAFDSSRTRYSTVSHTIVKHVLEVNSNWDFLKYEQHLDELAKRYLAPSVIVYQKDASLTSHYMVQAIVRGFSAITDGPVPTVGEEYSFRESALTFPQTNLVAFKQGLKRAFEMGINGVPDSDLIKWAVAVIQGIGPTSKSQASVDMVFAAALIIARAGTAVCLGEYRHYFRFGPGRLGHKPIAPVSLPHSHTTYFYKKGELSRTLVFYEVFNLKWADQSTWSDMLSMLVRVKHGYLQSDWSPGYGGPAWGTCTQSAMDVIIALMPFVLMVQIDEYNVSSSHADKYMKELVAACNRLITVSHNSGKCLTKLIAASQLEQVSQGHTSLALATSPFTWELAQHYVKY